jgi:uncharacterized phiE125 gp8 family phage protein
MYWDDDWGARGRVPRFSLTLVTPPVLDVLTIEEAKAHARKTAPDEDALVYQWIRAAQAKVEQDTEVALLTQTWDLSLEAFPSIDVPIRIPKRPIQSITYVKYYDSAGALQTVTAGDYVVDLSSANGLGLSPAKFWPVDLRSFQPVTVRFVAGYTDPELIPDDLRHAVRLLVGHFSEQFQATQAGDRVQAIDLGYDALIGPYMRHWAA